MKLFQLLALGASIAAAGCTDPAIEMTLRIPTANQMPANFDLSCVTAIDVVVAGNDKGSDETDPDQISRCIEIPSGTSSFAALKTAIAGKVDLNLPQSGLAAVAIRGRAGICDDSGREYESVFYGGAGYIEGQESMTIPLVANISCGMKKTYAVSTVDLLSIVRTKTCAMSLPPLVDEPFVYAGNIRPLMMGPEFPLMSFDYGESFVAADAAGKAQIQSYAAAGTPRSCIAIGFDTNGNYAGSCIYQGAPTLCGGPNELELATMDDLTAFASIDTTLVKQYGLPVYGAVFKASPPATTTKAVITGATVELEDPTQGKVVFVDPGPSKLVANAGTSTSASGMFMIYLKGEPTAVIVKSGGSQQRYIVASTGDEPSTLLAVLP
jgi:hypothetical protein